MGLEVRHLDGGVGVLFRCWGTVTDEEYLRVVAAHLFDDPERFAGYRYHVTDASEMEDARLSTRALKRAALACRDAARLHPNSVVAFVAPKALHFGLGRMFEMIVDPLIAWDFHVFKTRPEAEAWIRERCHERFGLTGIEFALEAGVVVPHDTVPKHPI